MVERVGSEPARERGARQAKQIAQVPKAHAAQRGDRVVFEPARRKRYCAERVHEWPRMRNRDAVRLRGEHVRSRRSRGSGERVVEAERSDLEAKAPEQRGEAAEQRQARADLE